MVARSFWWPWMRDSIQVYVQSCILFSYTKTPCHKPFGAQVPTETPSKAWSYITTDFIVELPPSKVTILIVVDQFTKMSHFFPCLQLPFVEVRANFLV